MTEIESPIFWRHLKTDVTLCLSVELAELPLL